MRAGHHCAHPILCRFGVETSVRPSLALYNTFAEIDTLATAVPRIQAKHAPYRLEFTDTANTLPPGSGGSAVWAIDTQNLPNDVASRTELCRAGDHTVNTLPHLGLGSGPEFRRAR